MTRLQDMLRDGPGGAVRVCPERDTVCPHGVGCPYADTRYTCKEGWRTPPEDNVEGNDLNSIPPFLLPSRRCGGSGRGGTLFCAPSFPVTFAGIRLARWIGTALRTCKSVGVPCPSIIFYNLKAASPSLCLSTSQNAGNDGVNAFPFIHSRASLSVKTHTGREGFHDAGKILQIEKPGAEHV